MDFKGKQIRFAVNSLWGFSVGRVLSIDSQAGTVLVRTPDMEMREIFEDEIIAVVLDGGLIAPVDEAERQKKREERQSRQFKTEDEADDPLTRWMYDPRQP